MKKTLSLIFAALTLLLSLTGCEKKPATTEPVTTAPSIAMLDHSYGGLFYQIGSDLEEAHRGSTYVTYEGDGCAVRVLCGTLPEGTSSVTDWARIYSAELVDSGYSCSMDRAGGVHYIEAEKDSVYQVYGLYCQDGFGWQMTATIFNTSSHSDLSALKQRMIDYVTSGVIEYLPDAPTEEQPAPTEPTPPATEDTVTVHVYFPTTWSTPYLWAWNDDTGEELYDQWPGVEMERVGNIYTMEVPFWVNSIVVSDMGSDTAKTADIYFSAGKDIWVIIYGNGNSTTFYEPPTHSSVPSGHWPTDHITIYAKVDPSWIPCCWAWNSGTGEDVFSQWPGSFMSYQGGYYIIELPMETDYFIISNLGDENQKTPDLLIDPGKDVFITVDADGTYTIYQ